MSTKAVANGEPIEIPDTIPVIVSCKLCDRILLPQEIGKFQGFCFQCWNDTEE